MHYEYAELLRTHVLPRGQKSDAPWKREVVSHYRKALAFADNDHKQPDAQLEQVLAVQSSIPTAATRLHIWNTMGLLLLDLDERRGQANGSRQSRG